MARSREDRKTRNLMHHKQAGSLIREGQPRPVDLVEGNPVFREDGKVIKSDNYKPPNLKDCV